MRYNQQDAQSAKPLLTAEQLGNIATHKVTYTIIGVVIIGGITFYFTHIEEVPVSGRRRFNCYSDEAIERDGANYYKMIMQDAMRDGTIVPSWDPRAKQVERVMRKLIPQSGLENAAWEVHVLESREANAFVLPGGKVFVYTGILPIAKTDDGLAAILGHEIAHNVARHSAESASRYLVINLPLRYLLIFLDNTGYTMGFGRVIGDILMGLGVTMPASRKQESEADYIGLMIMAKACYNPKDAVGVWERMEAANHGATPEWLSTHPSNANRAERIRSWLPKAEDARSESACAPLLQYQESFNNLLQGNGGVWSLLR